MGYSEIDPVIADWTNRHSFRLFMEQVGREIRCVYLSSIAGNVFQIWIEEPTGGRVTVYAGCVEGPKEDDLPCNWSVGINDLGAVLEEALRVVLDWMQPSTRYVPPKKTH